MPQNEGTYHFMPPEGCDPAVELVDSFKADVWALGVTLFAMTFGSVPFDADTEYLVMEAIRTQPLVLPAKQISNGLHEILLAMLNKDPTKRPKAEQLEEYEFLK